MVPSSVRPADRALRALKAVLPASVRVDVSTVDGSRVTVNEQPFRLLWLGEGALRDVRPILARPAEAPEIVAARQLSPAAREKLTDAGIGWVDESGAAEIALPALVVSRSGRRPEPARLQQWTPAVMAVAEALLCGTAATVAATEAATGLSAGSCTKALRFLTDRRWLEAGAARGRGSARKLADSDGLLAAYADAVGERAGRPRPSITVGLSGPDLLAALAACGAQWSSAKVSWATTGAAAAAVIAPYLGSLATAEVYLDAGTHTELEAVAATAGLRPIEGGRLTLRPFPTAATSHLVQRIGDVNVAPWPRVYADLRLTGVRGEEAAEHLREVVRG